MKFFLFRSMALSGFLLANMCLPVCAESHISQLPVKQVVAVKAPPLVVLLTSERCAVCKKMAPSLLRLRQTYQHRSQWVILDLSNRKSLAQAEAKVKELGIEVFYEKYAMNTGIFAVIDPQSKNILQLLIREDNPQKYQQALAQSLDQVLEQPSH